MSNKKFVFESNGTEYIVEGSLFDLKGCHIFVVCESGDAILEVLDLDEKYKLLIIARSIFWERTFG